MKHPIGITSNEKEVYVDLINSKAAKHIAEQPHLTELLKEALKAIAPTEPEVVIERDMKRPIGYDFVIETSEKDAVFYAKLVKETVYTRFVKNANPNGTQFLTILLRRDEDGSYELANIWVGRVSPPVPGSANETPASRPFWDKHAVVFANQPLQSQTLTRTCPYDGIAVAVA